MEEEGLLTINDVAEYLKVKKRTIYDWVRKKRIPAIKTVGQWRFKRQEIDAWLKQGHESGKI